MCGISGIVNKVHGAVDERALKVMNDSVSHRGPDGHGIYINGNVGLGHRRLSILDLSEQGAQPMKHKDDLVITYNGEVYNYIEVRETLRTKGHVFKGGSDTEVILAAYQEWGDECVHKFNGMWAFAIHDVKQNRLLISRDRFGVKPLYYCEHNNSFLFGSEIRQILTQVKERKVNKQILFDFLYLGYQHHSTDTFFENIVSLAPGHNIIIDLTTGVVEISKWYTLKNKEEYKSLSFEEAQKVFETTINESIRLRLRSDVKVGTCLSGGLDSSYIAAVASELYQAASGEKFTAITAKSIEKETDESDFAKKVVENSNLDWKVTQPEVTDFLKVAEEVIEVQEEPFGSPSIIMQYFVMKKSKEEGCTVLLDGQGGDESLLGYDRYYAAYILQQKCILKKIKSFFDIARNSKLGLIDLFLYTIYFSNAKVRAMRQLRRNKFVKQEFKSYLNKNLLDKISKVSRNISDLQHFEITQVQLQKLLKFEDRNSMHFSIETRVPFVDYRVVELSISLPFHYKMFEGWTKYILRKTAEKKLPDDIVWRKNKFGFEAPVKTWLADKSRLLEEIRSSEFLSHCLNKEELKESIDDTSLWKLYNVAVWSRKFDVKF